MDFNSLQFYSIFENIIKAWHNDSKPEFLYDSLAMLLSQKCTIDTQQWHLEDDIRDPEINPTEALTIKRKIDSLNQNRTNTVEAIEDWFVGYFAKNAKPLKEEYRIPTENVAWAIDRLSILALKIYHMEEQFNREDTTEEFKTKIAGRLTNLLKQKEELCRAIDNLIKEILNGDSMMCVYRQEKLYNDSETNPVLYKK